MTDDPPITATNAAPDTDPATDLAAASNTDLIKKPAPAGTPLAAPASPVIPPARRNLNEDIASILKEVKLPERRMPEPKSAPAQQVPALGALPTLAPAQGPLTQAKPRRPEVAVPPPQQLGDRGGESAATPVEALHTMKTDLQRTVRDRKISTVRAAALEEDNREARQKQKEEAMIDVPRKRGAGRMLVMLTATVLLIALGGAAIYFIYQLAQGNSSPQTLPASTTIIFAEQQFSFPLSGQSAGALKQALAGLLTQGGSVGSITQIIPTVSATDTAEGGRPATLGEFLEAIGADPPADLLRVLSDTFFFGIHMTNAPSPVFIIPVLSYDRAFADMLAWEPSMDAALSPPFTMVSTIVSSSTASTPTGRTFQDLVMQNYDVRALEDDQGNPVLYYSFPTPDLLIIAASPYSFPEILSRLQAQRKL